MAAAAAHELRTVELLVQQLYSPRSTQEQQAAEKSLADFANAPAFLAHCRFVLDNSAVPEAQQFAAFSLQRNVTKNFGLFETAEKLEIRNYIVQYLMARPKLDGYLAVNLAQLLSRVTKLGWFDSEELRNTVDLTIKLVQTSPPQYYNIGLVILAQLVQEMNQPGSQRTAARFRKIATTFRETHLQQIFQLGLSLVRQLLTQRFPGTVTELGSLQLKALTLVRLCLTFDFIGSATEDAADDSGSVQVPIGWRAHFEDTATTRLFFDCYNTFTDTAMTREAMECIVQLASIRRTLLGDPERHKYLSALVQGLQQIMSTGKGLHEVANYHELCRCLVRLKATHQLGELVMVDAYPEWIALVAALTTRSFQSFNWSPNSLQYLLNFWAKMITSSSYMVKPTRPHRLDLYIPQVFCAYVSARVQSVDQTATAGVFDDDEESLLIELDMVGSLSRWNYTESVAFLLSLFDPLATTYFELVQSGTALANDMTRNQLAQLQGRLTWLVNIMARGIGNRSTLQTLNDQDTLDGDQSSKIIQLISVHETLLGQMGMAKPAEDTLELAFLMFFQHFRKAYIGDQAQRTSKVYTVMSERLGLNDQDMLLNFIMRKLATNLSVWPGSDSIIQRTIDEFQVLSSGYNSLRTFARIETVHFILRNFNSQQFPFLDMPQHFKYRSIFSSCLTKLLFAEDADRMEERFVEFAKPISDRLEQLATITLAAEFRTQKAQLWLIGAFRDMRGIMAACDRKTYTLIFDWFYPRFMPVMMRALDALYDVPEVVIPILKFFAEFVQNRNGRIQFGNSSPSPIMLFRDTSELLKTFGERALTIVASADQLYPRKLKAIAACFAIFKNVLMEGAVNFSIFKIYGDPTLDKAIDMLVRLALHISLDDMMTYVKLGRSFFQLLETFVPEHLFSQQTSVPQEFLVYVLMCLAEGIKGVELAPLQQSCILLDTISTFVYRQVQALSRPALLSYGTPPVLHPLARYITERPDILRYFLYLLLQMVMFEETQIQFSVSRPLLPLILMNEQFFNEYATQLVQAQPQDKQEAVQTVLTQLMVDVDRSLQPRNRDTFVQKVTAVRRDLQVLSLQSPPPMPSPF